jgi:hypothetical protein
MSHRHLHPAHLERLKREQARRSLRTCAMPRCHSPVALDQHGGGLGLCFGCIIDLSEYIDTLDDAPALTERRLQRRYKELQADATEAARAEQRALAQGWIYYLRVDERIKVGYSADVRQRMRSYPPHARLVAVHPGTKTLEAQIHQDLHSALAAGREWFHPHAEVLAHIDRVLAEFGQPEQRHVYKFTEGTRQTIKPHIRSRKRGSRRR